jgi:hypothetical protein
MKKLSSGQLRAGSEIAGNIAVAWFSAGVISPLFIRPKDIPELSVLLGIGLVMAGLFTGSSLYLVRGIKS